MIHIIRVGVAVASLLFWRLSIYLETIAAPMLLLVYTLGGLYITGVILVSWLTYVLTRLKCEHYPLSASVGLGIIWPLACIYYSYWYIVVGMLRSEVVISKWIRNRRKRKWKI